MIELDARSIAAAVNARTLDPVEVADAFIARIAERNPSLNALCGFDPELARSEAQQVRARIAAGERPALAGVPVVVKDNIWVAGRRSPRARGSSRIISPREDAIAVARLRRAGACHHRHRQLRRSSPARASPTVRCTASPGIPRTADSRRAARPAAMRQRSRQTSRR